MANIITLAEYRTYDDAPSPAENDAQITAAIGLATAHIEQKTGRVFEIADDPSPNDEIETINGKGTSRVYTHNAPITAVSKIEYWNGTAWTEYDSTTYPYTFKVGSNIVYFTQGHKFYSGYQNIRVTFEYGHTTSFPSDLKLACWLIAKYLISESERLGINNQSDGEQTFSFDHKIPVEAVKIVTRYRTVW